MANYHETKRKFKQELITRLKAAYLRGVPSHILAKQAGITMKTFYRWLKPTREEKAEHNKNLWLINRPMEEK